MAERLANLVLTRAPESHTRLLVLYALAHFATDGGIGVAESRGLRALARCHRETLSAHLRSLRDRGYLEFWTEPGNGARVRYRLTLDALRDLPDLSLVELVPGAVSPHETRRHDGRLAS